MRGRFIDPFGERVPAPRLPRPDPAAVRLGRRAVAEVVPRYRNAWRALVARERIRRIPPPDTVRIDNIAAEPFDPWYVMAHGLREHGLHITFVNNAVDSNGRRIPKHWSQYVPSEQVAQVRTLIGRWVRFPNETRRFFGEVLGGGQHYYSLKPGNSLHVHADRLQALLPDYPLPDRLPERGFMTATVINHLRGAYRGLRPDDIGVRDYALYGRLASPSSGEEALRPLNVEQILGLGNMMVALAQRGEQV